MTSKIWIHGGITFSCRQVTLLTACIRPVDGAGMSDLRKFQPYIFDLMTFIEKKKKRAKLNLMAAMITNRCVYLF